MLFKLCPRPDAVTNQRTRSVKGYERNMAMLQGWFVDGGRVQTMTISLEGSDAEALQAAAAYYGFELADDYGSEELMGKEILLSGDHETWLEHGSAIRDLYDEVLVRRDGKRRYSGDERFVSKQDALSYIRSQDDLLEEHMREISRIQALVLDAGVKSKLLEKARVNYASGLDAQLEGRSFSSLGDAGDIMSSEGYSYGGYCATSSAEGQAQDMGMLRGTFVSRNCPICGAANITTTVEGDIISGKECGCSREICGSRVTRGTKLQKETATVPIAAPKTQPPAPKNRQTLQERYGEHAEIRVVTGIGGVDRVVINRLSQEVIARL